MKKDLKDYLHLYLGCEVMLFSSSDNPAIKPNRVRMVGRDMHDHYHITYEKALFIGDVKPILHRLEDMTLEDFKKVSFSGHMDDLDYVIARNRWAPEHLVYLLKNGFDLFGLIEEGLAIDAKTLQQ